ncbi:transglutaminase-like cysteine peptidase [Rhizobium sp. RU36D]|uniref:transglutaminase-like cysteine peptidase n=1 Tax=Rhizobium sp. RU36D TaxID=1907415 RepID=UPI0009D7FAF2|nr:transglutaminase-like cysteine peptidase [Rhizobium sp. RU36D]SMD15654.1 Predicted transglutaminase-like cysteine proteinase [Rhizobium sp. RU36D]
MMMKKALGALAVFAAIASTQIGTVNAAPLGSLARQHDFSGKKLPPLQFQLFCIEHPDQCKASSVSQVSYSPKIKNIISSVNSSVNRQIKPKQDKSDVWRISATEGDCDDYVMTKRQRLIRAGLPASALRVAVVRTQSGEGHAVLLVKTSSGEYVLDNLRPNIVKRHQSGYRYISVSSSDPMKWTR